MVQQRDQATRPPSIPDHPGPPQCTRSSGGVDLPDERAEFPPSCPSGTDDLAHARLGRIRDPDPDRVIPSGWAGYRSWKTGSRYASNICRAFGHDQPSVIDGSSTLILEGCG